MRYGIFGDIHSNLEALDGVLGAFENEAIDKYVCVGDIVGYGVDAHECIKEVRRLDAMIVCGNHDWGSAGLLDRDYFNHIARLAVEWTAEILDEDEKEFLRSLGLVMDERDFSVVHGSMYRPELFYYTTDTPSAKRCFLNMKKDVCFIGHSHVPGVFFMSRDRIDYTTDSCITIRQGIKYIVNVGSVGQPRDYNPMAGYCIFDSSEKTVEIKRVSYDIGSAKDKILKSSLPDILGYRLMEGR